jgi:hypothetical protein
MTTEEAGPFVAGVIIGFIAVVVVLLLSQAKPIWKVHADAIAEGHAHYNTMTGEFEWNKPCGSVPPKDK